MKVRLLLSILLPFIALALQWLLWPWITPFVWFLFFPSVFFSARLGGFWGGLTSTVLCAAIVWFFFIPPQLSWAMDNPANLYSVGMFLVMGYLFSETQDRLRLAQRNSETALAETRAANEKITQLYQKTLELDELKSQFFANVSHELRTPLTLIMSPLARRLSNNNLPEAERHENEIMLRNARQLYRHVTDLLDVAKLEAGQMTLAWARLDLVWLTRSMASHFESLAAERHIDYTVTVPDTLSAEADGEKLQRILLNLLSNAFKFTPDGGAIALRLSQKDGYALFEVQDNGPGVQVNLRAAVFERFRQIEGGTQRRFGGTGLGLSIVKDFVELHGGTVSLDETPGGGALFSVQLPLAAPTGTVLENSAPLDALIDHQAIEELENHTQAVPSSMATTPAVDAPLVLVVEDNADMNGFIAAILSPHYRICTAFNGREGLNKALTLHPDLILTDLMMPKMSGDQMVHELRRQKSMRDVPIVILTAKADDKLRLSLLKDAVQDYLNKPFSTEELLARITGLLATRQRTVEKLRRLNADLERRVQQRTAELTASNQELDSFAYAVSHDLRAPLRAMSGFSQALSEDYGDLLQGEAKVYLEQIDLASRKMAELIDGILALSRSTRGVLQHDAVDLSALAERLLSELAQRDPERQVALTVEPGLQALGDARMLEAMLANLLGNAWKYTARTQTPSIRVYAGEQDGARRFCVADNGAGFDMAHANRLFQPFQRLHRQEEFPGIGIGLATVQRIVHRHGGIIDAHGEPGKGAIFCFTLPDMPAHTTPGE